MTMKPITPELKLDAHQDNEGIHINSLIMKHNGNNYHLYVGTKGTIYIFTESIALYVLTVNKEHGTICMSSYMSPEPFPLNSFYLHSVKETVALFGQKREQFDAKTIVLKLIDFLM